MTDPETRAAVDALTRRLRNRDPGTDDEVFALEFITGLRARGWRPTEARVMPAWKRPAGHGTEPTSDYLAARQELDARLARELLGYDASVHPDATGADPGAFYDSGGAA